MSYLDDLIASLCPDGVTFQQIGHCVELKMGTSPNGSTFSSNPLLGVEFHQGKTFFGGEKIAKSNVYTSSPIVICKPNSVLMSVRAPVGDVNMADREVAIGRGLCSMVGKRELSTKFLYHFIKANIQEIKRKSIGSTYESINTKEIKSIKIPVPPLPVQEEIVRILDKFTGVVAELEAELEARIIQYEHYCEILLADANFQLYKLSELCTISNGKDHKPLHDGPYPVYGTGGVMRYVDSYIYDKESVLIPRKGSLNKVYYLDKPFWVVDTIFYTKIITERIIPKFLYHALVVERLEKLDFAGGIPSLTKTILDSLVIKVPSLNKQIEIVRILDYFESLISDLKSGLPAEIAARRKQYEYYRDRLLTFREKPA